ncbi:hypothetical protein O181_018511 [Austropuccinia psidii MF-1]|uniref:Uncharacterized protein n=1 Tax=Austropuccinia psidii MF-1 TaxID=1389203 RepID=A0A9Q3GT08_9BASI|nr:hypothetical protein [Austropuccinia psidii MF-1]
MDPRYLNLLSKENVGDEVQNNVGDSILIWGKEESSAELKADDKAEDSTAIGLLGSEVKEDELSKLINETDSSINNVGEESFPKVFNEFSSFNGSREGDSCAIYCEENSSPSILFNAGGMENRMNHANLQEYQKAL